jgi:Tellurite resistance protein TehB
MRKKDDLKKMLELGCDQRRDTLFLASKGIDVTAFDYSSIAINTSLFDAYRGFTPTKRARSSHFQ